MHVVRLSLYLFTLALVLILGGCGSSSAVQPGTSHTSPSPSTSAPAAVTPTVLPIGTAGTTVAMPVRLLVPAIGVNAPVESLGILPDGTLATPTRSPWEDVGWYDAGPRPGQHGSAVIDGHLDRPGGYPAVFWRLRSLHAGDAVWVIYTDGTRLHFRVTRVALYPPEEAPIQDIFGNNGGTYLNLITCAGDWIPSEHQTTLRLVVYTALA